MTREKTVYEVSGKHRCPEWACDRERITVHRDGDGFYADSGKYGCGKIYRSATAAIYEMLADHAVTVTRCVKIEG